MLVETNKYQSVFPISETVRVVAEQYTNNETTAEYADGLFISLHTIQAARGIMEWNTDSGHSDAIATIISDSKYQGNFADTSLKIAKYFDNANQYAYRSPEDRPYAYVFHSFKGYSQGEWNDAVAYSNTYTMESLEDMVNTRLDNFYKGELYLVSVERAKVFTALDGSTITEWHTDHNYEVHEVLEQFFVLTADFIYENYELEVQP